jgi:hypothetical protein
VFLSGCVAIQGSPDPAMTREANKVWKEVQGHPAWKVEARASVGTPGAIAFNGTVYMFVPAGSPPPLATFWMRYELSKIAFALGDGSLLSNILQPVRTFDATFHGASEVLSWKAAFLPPERPKEHYRDSVFENPVWKDSWKCKDKR